MALTATQIQNAYVAFFNRPADVAGLNYWSSYAGSEADLLNTFAQSSEYQDLYANLNNTQIVNAVYQNLFNHAPDVAGLNYWVSQLDNGALGIGNVADAINKGAQGTDAAIITNKVAAAESFTAALDTTPEIVAYAGINAAGISAVKTWLNTVDSDPASVTAATGEAMDNLLKTVQSNSSAGGVTQTFTLTSGIDLADDAGAFRNGTALAPGEPFNFKFTTANEGINATNLTLGGIGLDTLSDPSTVDNDVLSLALGAGARAIAGNAIGNIETINISTSSTTIASAVVDLTGVTGGKTVNVTGAPGAGVVLVLPANPGDTGITTVDGSGMTSAVNGLTAIFAGSTSTAALTLKGSLAADLLVGAGGADTIEGNGGDDVIFGGAGSDTLTGGDGVDTINGGANDDTIAGDAGNDTLNGDAGNDSINGGAGIDTIAGGAGNDTIVGGAGNDVITTGGGTDTVTGGAGNDAVTLTASATALDKETIKFEATAADNGADTYAGFTAGAIATGGDVLDFTAFLGRAASFAAEIATGTVSVPAPVGGYTAAAGENVIVVENDAAFDGGDSLVSLAEFQASSLELGANAKSVVIYEGAVDSVIYYVATDVNGDYATATLVGTLTAATDPTWVAANFA